MYDYDVIIVGAGPAGTTAGYILGSYGLKVLVVDRSRFPRKKLCAGCLTHKTIQLLQRVYGESVDSLKERGVIDYESDIYEILYRDRPLIKRRYPLPFYFVDRTVYDNFLLNKVKGAGVEVIEGEAVVSYELLKNELRTSSRRRLRARFVVGADGVNSIIRRTFATGPFNQRLWDKNMATALEVFVDRAVIDRDIGHPMILFGFIDYGYSWVFPNKGQILIGSCGLNRVNRKRFIDSFRELLSYMKLDGLDDIRIESHPLPSGGFLTEPVFGNTLLIGDAAGFTDPMLGEGIYYAQRSGELAAHAIYRAMKNNEAIGEVYNKLLHEIILPDFIYALKLRGIVFGYLNRFQFAPMRILFNLFGDIPVEVVHGLRTYKWFKKREKVS
jgi:geranylgeranyl reductase family protein